MPVLQCEKKHDPRDRGDDSCVGFSVVSSKHAAASRFSAWVLGAGVADGSTCLEIVSHPAPELVAKGRRNWRNALDAR